MSPTTSNSGASRAVTLSFHSMRIPNQIQMGTLSPSQRRWPILLPQSFSTKPWYRRPFVPLREGLRSRWALQMLGSEVDHPSEEQKDTHDNQATKRGLFPASWGPGIRLTQWVSTQTPNTKFRLLLYFLDISHGHTAIFMVPGVTYF
jgi:hypothetical protein